MMKKKLLALALTLALFVGAVGPSAAIFDKTRFVTDLGVAYFAFHHWVWKPYKAGAFAAGAPHRTKALVKAGLAMLFAANRVQAANNLAHKSKSPLLQKLAGSVDSMQSAFLGLGQRLKSGNFDAKNVEDANGALGSVDAGATNAGLKVKDVPVAIPGT